MKAELKLARELTLAIATLGGPESFTTASMQTAAQIKRHWSFAIQTRKTKDRLSESEEAK